MPAHRKRGLEFLSVLRIDQAALIQCQLLPLRVRKIARRYGLLIKVIISYQYSLATQIIIGGIKDLGKLIIGMRDPPIDSLVFLPEPALELQPDLAGTHIDDGIDRPARIRTKIVIDIGQH